MICQIFLYFINTSLIEFIIALENWTIYISFFPRLIESQMKAI